MMAHEHTIAAFNVICSFVGGAADEAAAGAELDDALAVGKAASISFCAVLAIAAKSEVTLVATVTAFDPTALMYDLTALLRLGLSAGAPPPLLLLRTLPTIWSFCDSE